MGPTNGYCPICRVAIARGVCALHPEERLVKRSEIRALDASEARPPSSAIVDLFCALKRSLGPKGKS